MKQRHSQRLIMKELSKEHGQLKPIDFRCRLSFPDTCTEAKELHLYMKAFFHEIINPEFMA